jgi:hypothetical protein
MWVAAAPHGDPPTFWRQVREISWIGMPSRAASPAWSKQNHHTPTMAPSGCGSGAFSYQCAQCGAFNVPLQVHHRNGDRRDNSFANLAPMCRDCHKEAGSQLF